MIHQSEAAAVEAQVSAYLKDTYQEQSETRVLAVGEQDGTPWAAVEQCLFHPQGGGQPADRGWLEDAEIVPVRDRESGLIVAMGASGGNLPLFAAGQPVGRGSTCRRGWRMPRCARPDTWSRPWGGGRAGRW